MNALLASELNPIELSFKFSLKIINKDEIFQNFSFKNNTEKIPKSDCLQI